MENNKKQQKGGYGIFSLMAMIIGIVIGSGIFAKNAGLIAINGSIVDTMIAWLIGGVLVIAILIAFLEIISITEITNEQSTLANWGRHLCGKKFGNFVGYYMVFVYFPMIIAGLLCFTSSQFADTLGDLDISIFPAGAADSAANALGSQVVLIAISGLLIAVLFFMNSFTSKPGRILQNVGTTIKTIPLFFLVALLVVMLIIGLPGGNLGDIQESIDKSEIGSKVNHNNSEFALILMTLPGILFAVDGFLLAGSLSKESNKPSSFKTAFLFSIIFILIIYILYSFATLALGNPNEAKYGSISNAIFNVFENETVAKTLAVATGAIITLSMIVGISGCIITCMRMYTDLSVHNAVVDENLQSVTKNEHGVAPISGFWVGINTIAWIIIAFAFDIVNIFAGSGKYILITDYMTNLIVVGIFFIYSIVILAALANRFTKKVETKKNIAFIPAAIVASLMIIAITTYDAYLILNPGHPDSSAAWTAWGLKLGFTILYLVYIFGIFGCLTWRTSNLSEEFINRKAKAASVYYGETEQASAEEEIDRALNIILTSREERKIN